MILNVSVEYAPKKPRALLEILDGGLAGATAKGPVVSAFDNPMK
jgi:hypothetical protein